MHVLDGTLPLKGLCYAAAADTHAISQVAYPELYRTRLQPCTAANITVSGLQGGLHVWDCKFICNHYLLAYIELLFSMLSRCTLER